MTKRIAAVTVAALLASSCQTVVESGEEAPLTPLGTPTETSSTTSTSTSTATTSTTTTLPPTTLPPTTLRATTLPATTLPATTVTPTLPATAPSTTIPGTTSTSVSATTTTEPFYRDEPTSGTLREGDRGERTKAMQAKLIALGYLNAGADDGLFGKVTTAAVEQFQDDSDLEVDGLVGPNTTAALDAAVNEL